MRLTAACTRAGTRGAMCISHENNGPSKGPLPSQHAPSRSTRDGYMAALLCSNWVRKLRLAAAAPVASGVDEHHKRSCPTWGNRQSREACRSRHRRPESSRLRRCSNDVELKLCQLGVAASSAAAPSWHMNSVVHFCACAALYLSSAGLDAGNRQKLVASRRLPRRPLSEVLQAVSLV